MQIISRKVQDGRYVKMFPSCQLEALHFSLTASEIVTRGTCRPGGRAWVRLVTSRRFGVNGKLGWTPLSWRLIRQFAH